MSDWPRDYQLLGSHSVSGYGHSLLALQTSAPASTAWPSANLAIFVPMLINEQCVAYKLICGAGLTAEGNFDIGIFDADGRKLISSGATAKGLNVVHTIDITDTPLGPGLYYMGMSADSADAYAMVTPAGTAPVPLQKSRLYGTLQMATAYPLPATATFAARTFAPVPVVSAILRRL